MINMKLGAINMMEARWDIEIVFDFAPESSALDPGSARVGDKDV